MCIYIYVGCIGYRNEFSHVNYGIIWRLDSLTDPRNALAPLPSGIRLLLNLTLSSASFDCMEWDFKASDKMRSGGGGLRDSCVYMAAVLSRSRGPHWP